MFDNVVFACVCCVFYHFYVSFGVLLPVNFVFFLLLIVAQFVCHFFIHETTCVLVLPL